VFPLALGSVGKSSADIVFILVDPNFVFAVRISPSPFNESTPSPFNVLTKLVSTAAGIAITPSSVTFPGRVYSIPTSRFVERSGCSCRRHSRARYLQRQENSGGHFEGVSLV